MSAQISIFEPMIVDNFAGGGGASTGIEMATGHPVDIAINHDESAILMHQRNHPFTRHYQDDVWIIDPVKVTGGRPVHIAWFSPDCKHFSRAKGAALCDKKIRGLAWVAVKWAGLVHPDIIMLENVPEFVTWGPVRKGKPVKSKSGQTFARWKQQLEDLGYVIEYRELCAADYGAPTIRTRFVLIARRDGKPIVWPTPTHAPRNSAAVKEGRLKPWRSAAEIIDWSLPCYSIFQSKEQIAEEYGVKVVRPLRPNTLRRIARGIDKFVLNCAEPFIMCNNAQNRPHSMSEPLHTVTTKDREGITAVYIDKYFAGNYTGCGSDAKEPLGTVTTHDRNAVTLAHLAHFKGKDKGQDARDPLMTVTASDGQFAQIRTIAVKYDGGTDLGYWPQVREMLNAYTDRKIGDDEILLLHIGDSWYFIRDIGLRMLSPRELYNAMGFPPDYIIDRDINGKKISRSDQIARCGNAVCPPMAAAVVRANCPELCPGEINTMNELHDIMTA